MKKLLSLLLAGALALSFVACGSSEPAPAPEGNNEPAATDTAKSPDNTYIAWVVSSDQGALGGSTQVYVRNTQKDIPFVSGMLKTESKNLWSGRWGTEVTLCWEDDDTLMIDGKSYDVE